MTQTIPSAAPPAAVPAVASPSPRDAGPLAAPRTGSGAFARSATLLVLLAFTLAVVHFVVLLSDYKNVFVHPDFHQANLGFVMRSGLSIGLHDFIDILQIREANEFRPRWLMYYLETLDHKVRMQLYRWIPVYPTLGPVTWPIQLIVTPLLLYLLMARLTSDRMAALAAVAVYVSGTGFLSGFTMALMPGKTLSNLIYITVFYAALVAAQRIRPGEFLIESRGPAKYLLILVLTLGLFLDELPIAAFLMLPAMFWRHIFPRSLSVREVLLFVKNGLFLSLPIVGFLFVVLIVVPPITERYLGYRFDYLSEMLHQDGNTRTGTSLLDGPKASLTPAIVFENFTTLFGMSLAPRYLSPLVEKPWGEYPGSQVNNPPKLVIFLVFFGTALLVAVRARGTVGMYLRGLLVALVLFILFLSLLSVRHIPVVTGFYYGASFASLFAVLVGVLFAGLSQIMPMARPVAALAVIAIVATQIVNFWPVNEGWLTLHNEQMARARVLAQTPRFQRRFPLEPGRPLTKAEVDGIWEAWTHGQLQPYIESHKLSPSASYELFELREIDRQLRKQGPDDDD